MNVVIILLFYPLAYASLFRVCHHYSPTLGNSFFSNFKIFFLNPIMIFFLLTTLYTFFIKSVLSFEFNSSLR